MPKSFLAVSPGEQRQDDIPCDNGCKATGSQEYNHGNACQYENKLNFIVLP